MFVIFANLRGFVMNYESSGPELKYTLGFLHAQTYDTWAQANFAAKFNSIEDFHILEIANWK